MMYFGIPLRSKAASKNWTHVEEVFGRTLNSICRQTDPEFKVLVACHDVPRLNKKYDDRVEFLISDSPLPTNYREMMFDKGWKISMIAKRLRELGGVFDDGRF